MEGGNSRKPFPFWAAEEVFLQHKAGGVSPGDVLVCYKLDRVGRSLKDLVDTVNVLKTRGIGFLVLTQQLDTTTPAGMLIFHVFGAIAEFERSLIQERTSAGLKAARPRGRFGGRPKTLDQKKGRLLSRFTGTARPTSRKYVRLSESAGQPSIGVFRPNLLSRRVI
jgi:DNA invertase Pin-like site-specific DNA recombinase